MRPDGCLGYEAAMEATQPTFRARDRANERDRGRTLAQWYCYAIGAILALAGALGFFADATFDTSASQARDPVAGGNANDRLQGDGLVGFEVNGWHNVVHLVSGIVLLLLASQRGSARLGAIAFGLVYALVTVIGLIDGNDVLGILPVNAPDNLLHIALSLLGLIAGFASPGGRDDDRSEPPPPAAEGAYDDGSDASLAHADARRDAADTTR